MFQPNASTIDTISTDVAFLILLLHMIAHPAMAISRLDTEWKGRLLFTAGTVAAVYAYLDLLDPSGDIQEKLRKKIEETQDATIDALNEGGVIAYRSAHPASFADNPLFEDIALPDGHHLSELQDRFSVFHNKVQLIKRERSDEDPPASDDFAYVAYIGGMDFNPNRLDAPGHHGSGFRNRESPSMPRAAPYHDVHARVRGEAVVDAFGVFADRFAFDVSPVAGDPATQLPFAVPDAAIFTAHPGEHLVQVSQTEFRASDPARGFPWSRDGNRTNSETFLRAIESAQEYIYIEDQYLVPDDRYIHALVAASEHCRRLVILALSAIDDIPFGEDRRLAMFQRLAQAWGARVLIGSPHRRPVLDPADRTASIGRLTLVGDVAVADTAILVAPPARVPPDARFFFWINGELMFALSRTNVTDGEGLPAARLEVIRGGVGSEPRWCPHPRAHKKGSPVTAAHPLPIYVHSKIMMVDDVFVSIGSMNLNRRGFYHDGEMNASAVATKLAAARDNPARKLRVALWAEHLGIEPAMGEALLGDPIAAFELFRRSRYEGNRFTPFREFLVPHAATQLPKMLEGIVGQPAYILLESLVQAFLFANRSKIYNAVSDPTTGLDPSPEPGPEID
jgi:phosphatidylserine/phosphatidylglycerophosphate/cardiolipin synthase-like enzyme